MSMSERAFRFLLYRCSGSVCGVKSRSWPGTLYSYGPRWTSIGLSKLPCGGGVGVCHSSVVAPHGLSEVTYLPFFMLTKKLIMNGIWARPRSHAAHEMCRFISKTHCGSPTTTAPSAGASAPAYVTPPSYMRRDRPAMPCANIGWKIRFMNINEVQKWTLPQNSFINRPVAFGYQ